MNIESNQQVLTELRKSKEFIKLNWNDSIAEQYLIWVEQAEEKLKKAEQRREAIYSKLCDIQTICQNAIDDSDDDPKTLKRVRTL